MWALDTTANGGPALHAYDATNLSIRNSITAVRRRLVTRSVRQRSVQLPLVANGYVYIGTRDRLTYLGAAVNEADNKGSHE